MGAPTRMRAVRPTWSRQRSGPQRRSTDRSTARARGPHRGFACARNIQPRNQAKGTISQGHRRRLIKAYHAGRSTNQAGRSKRATGCQFTIAQNDDPVAGTYFQKTQLVVRPCHCDIAGSRSADMFRIQQRLKGHRQKRDPQRRPAGKTAHLTAVCKELDGTFHGLPCSLSSQNSTASRSSCRGQSTSCHSVAIRQETGGQGRAARPLPGQSPPVGRV